MNRLFVVPLQINLIKTFLNILCLFHDPQAVYFLIHIEREMEMKRVYAFYIHT
jgi:hypothetical protein